MSQNSPEGDTSAIDLNQTRAEEQFQFAEGLRQREFYDLAAREYEKVVTDFSTSDKVPNANYFQAECLWRLGDTEKAIALLDELRTRYQDQAIGQRALIKLATILFETGKLKYASQLLRYAYETPIFKGEVRESVIYYLGVIAVKDEQFPEATSLFSEIVSKKPTEAHAYHPYALLQLGYLNLNLGRSDQASRYFDRLSENAHVPEPVVEEALFQRGEIAYLKGNYLTAAESYTRLLHDYPEGRFLDNAWLKRNRSYLNLRNYQKIIDLFSERTAQDLPVSDESLYIHGLALVNLGYCQQAEAVLHDLTSRFPESDYQVYAEYELIQCHFNGKSFDDGLARIKIFKEKFDDSKLISDVYFLEGQLLLNMDRLTTAVQALEAGLARFGAPWAYYDDAAVALGDTYRKLKEYKKAAESYMKLLISNSYAHPAQALFLAAHSESLAGDGLAAFSAYEWIIRDYRQSSEAPLALLAMAEIRIRDRAYADAIEILQRYFVEFSEHESAIKAIYLRGMVYYAIEEFDAAVSDLREFVGKTASHENIDHNQAKLILVYSLWESKNEKEGLEIFAEILQGDEQGRKAIAPYFLDAAAIRFIDLNNFRMAENCLTLMKENSDPKVGFLGMIGLGKIALKKGDLDAAEKLFYDLKIKTRKFPAIRGLTLSYLGETLRLLGRADEAHIAFQEALKLEINEDYARIQVRLGLARLYFEQQNLDEALRFAISVFVLFNDRELTPRAMLLAVQILAQQGKENEAKTTYDELEERYPAALAYFRSREDSRTLFLKQFE